MGLPASGKTYFSQRFAADEDIFFLNCDNLRLAMIEHPTFKPAEHALVYKTVRFIAEQHLRQGQSIVCNANYHRRDRREMMEKLAQETGADYQIVWVKTPYELVKERIQSRDHEIPIEKMVDSPLKLLQNMQAAFQAPDYSEPVIIVDGTKPYPEQRKQYDSAVANTEHTA